MIGTTLKFGWKNIWRNKRRTCLTISAVALTVSSLIFLQSYLKGVINNSNEEMIKTQIGHIKIAHKEFLRLERILPRDYRIGEDELSLIQNYASRSPEIDLLCETVKFHVLISHKDVNEPVMAIGIAPDDADKSMALSQKIVQGEYYNASGNGLSLIIGKGLAQKLKVSVHDEILLLTTDINYSSYALPFKISGIFETGYSSMDKHLLYLPLKKAQEMLDCGQTVHEVLVFLKNPGQAVKIAGKIRETLSSAQKDHPLQAIPWQQDDYIKNFLPALVEIMDAVLVIFFIIVGMVILNTMLMAVMERYQEIGVLKALGFKDGQVRFMVLAEAFLIGTIGSVIGALLGGAISVLTERVGIDLTKTIGAENFAKLDIPVPMFGKVLYPDFTLSILFTSMAFGILLAVMGALYPALKSSRMSPTEAFHSELKV